MLHAPHVLAHVRLVGCPPSRNHAPYSYIDSRILPCLLFLLSNQIRPSLARPYVCICKVSPASDDIFTPSLPPPVRLRMEEQGKQTSSQASPSPNKGN
jgi:hypothetical protein